ncbi:MAG: HK97 family phage prohead protease [Candidatus Brocadiales bacterium]
MTCVIKLVGATAVRPYIVSFGPFCFYRLNTVKKEKNMPNILYKAFQAEVLDQEDSRRTLWATASLEEPDREGDVIVADGWELENYRKNPVILFAHKYDQPPVARALGIGVSQKGLRFKAQFPSRKEYPFADTIYQLYRGGYLRSFSVGFVPKLWEDRKSVSGDVRVGRLFRRQELVEISVVPIPTHPKALAEAQKKGLLGREEVRVLEDMAGPVRLDGTIASSEAEAEREALVRLEKLLKGAQDLQSQATLSQKEVVAVVERAMEESLDFRPWTTD